VRKRSFMPLEAPMIDLVKQKLAIPGNESVDVSSNRLAALRRQLDTELKTGISGNSIWSGPSRS